MVIVAFVGHMNSSSARLAARVAGQDATNDSELEAIPISAASLEEITVMLTNVLDGANTAACTLSPSAKNDVLPRKSVSTSDLVYVCTRSLLSALE